jgi:hypothetical protein
MTPQESSTAVHAPSSPIIRMCAPTYASTVRTSPPSWTLNLRAEKQELTWQADSTTGFVPVVTTCADGSYCCDNDPQCCSAGRGAWLDDSGQQVASPPAHSSSGLPSDAKVAIGLGVPLAALMLGIAIWFLRRRLRASILRRQQEAETREIADIDTSSPLMYQHRVRYAGGWNSTVYPQGGMSSGPPRMVELPARA